MQNKSSVSLAIILSLAMSFCFSNFSFAEKDSREAANNINAAILYNESIASLKGIPNNFLKISKDVVDKGWSEEYSDLKEILKQNKDSIEKFKMAAKIRYCDFTLGKTIKRTAVSPFSIPANIFTPLRLVLVEARLYEKENKWSLVLADYIDILKFEGQLNQQSSSILMSKMYGSIVKNLVYIPLVQFINRKDISIQDCQVLLDQLISLKNKNSGLENVSEEEKEIAKNTIRLAGEEAKKKGQYDENLYQRFYQEFDKLADEYFGYLSISSKENKPEKFRERLEQLDAELEKETKPLALAKGALGGKIGLSKGIDSPYAKQMVLLTMSGYTNTITKYYVQLTKLNLLITASAIKLYQLKNGKLPENLQELMPGCLTKSPDDPFDNFNPLRYKIVDKGWIVYSLGPDKEDDDAALEYTETKANARGDIIFSSF